MKVNKKLTITAISILAISSYFVFTNQADLVPENKLTSNTANIKASFKPVEEHNKWISYIDELGPEKAYAEFKEAYMPYHFGIQHSAAHLMGELLYEKLGIKGITTCDATFAFGCYHSFFGRALSANGTNVVKELDEACVEAYGPMGTGCTHGIGHGLLEYFGTQQLLEALDACKLTTQLKALFGCTSGVFMEYNVPIVFDDTTAITMVRELNPANPHEPCNTIVPEKFRESCYYEMGQWWDKTFSGDYEKMGLLCEEVENKYKEPCYLGIGNVSAPSSEYNVQATIEKCLMMPNYEAKLMCRAGASWSFFAVPEKRDLAYKLCEELPEGENGRCAKKADLTRIEEKSI